MLKQILCVSEWLCRENINDKFIVCESCLIDVKSCDNCGYALDRFSRQVLKLCKRHHKKLANLRCNFTSKMCFKCAKYFFDNQRADCVDPNDREVSYCFRCYAKELRKPLKTNKLNFATSA